MGTLEHKEDLSMASFLFSVKKKKGNDDRLEFIAIIIIIIFLLHIFSRGCCFCWRFSRNFLDSKIS